MPTPPKPFSVLTLEGKSHRTKKELNIRKKGEEELTSGKSLKAREETKKNKEAAKEFRRVNDLLKGIGKNDALYEAVVNRYCMLQAECRELEKRKEDFLETIEEMKESFQQANDGTGVEEAERKINFAKMMLELTKSTLDMEKIIQQKRKMLFEIEKENVMTIASALRSIPKKEGKKENALLKALGNDSG